MIIPDAIENYIASHTSPETEVLAELTRETHLNVLMPNMLSGQVQGVLLKMMMQMLQPKCVLEIGTFTGYSAICMASGMPIDSVLYTIDINEELESMAAKYFEKAGLDGMIHQMIGNALDIVPEIDETFDLVFIDADKANYSRYYDLVFPKLRVGGYILADNVLWKGKVADESKNDHHTKALKEFNLKVQQDERVENVLLSVRDGLMLARKIKE